MEAWMAFVSIMAIVAIVLLGGGIIAFIGHMIIGAFDSKKDAPVQRKDVLDYSEFKQLEQSKLNVEETKDFDFEAIKEAKNEKIDEDIFKLDAEIEKDADLEDVENRLKAKAEEAQPVETVSVQESQLEEDKAISQAEEVEDEDVDDLLDEISNDVIAEEQEAIQEENEPKMSEELNAYSIDKILNETDDSEDLEEEAEPEIEELIEEDEESESTDENRTEVVDKEVEELKAQLEDLNRQLAEARSSKVEVVTLDMTEDECVARLETLEERLKNAKKDYKINMKEYRPLKKVMNDLERYQTKLRRKEAIVAKKKVALYGVNNYVDIDKEKAEKLANELELLDGLRLSVNHCEEVINANKDRFPILEHSNQILEEQIANIESDIETTKTTLQKIRDKKGEGENK